MKKYAPVSVRLIGEFPPLTILQANVLAAKRGSRWTLISEPTLPPKQP